MLICLLGALGHLLQALLLALLQPLILLLTLLCGHRLVEERIIQIRQILLRAACREHHSVKVFGISIHLDTQFIGHLHLTLQNGRSRLSSAHQMPTSARTLLEHHQPDGILLREHQLLDGCRLLRIIAIHIVEEVAADTLTACKLAFCAT